MKIWLRRPRRLPRGIKTRLAPALHPKKVRPPLQCRIELRRQRPHRNRQLRLPYAPLLIDPHRSRHPTLQITRPRRRRSRSRPDLRPNIQINPKPIRTDLKLLVMARLRWIRLQKRLRDIAIPQAITASVRIRIVKYEQLPIAASKSYIQRTRSPQDSYLGLPLRIGVLALPVRTKDDRARVPPLRRRIASIQRNFAPNPRGRNRGQKAPPFARLHGNLV